MSETLPNPIDRLARESGSEWPSIRNAQAATAREKESLRSALDGLVSREDMSVVVFGSLARGEVTSGSDADWTLLIDGQATSTHFDVSREIGKTFDRFKNGPGREATFGGLAFSHQILHRIGGAEDTNRNLTQRILLLLESDVLGPREAYERVLRAVLHRYIMEDAGWDVKSVTLPRFLLNDVARYWRTVAVDFAYKRREREANGWALRTVKLRLSRKLTYASGLLACYSCALAASVHAAEDRSTAVIEQLLKQASLTPLQRIAVTACEQDLLQPAIRVFDSYDRFLAILDSDMYRSELDALRPEEASLNELYQQARELGHSFQAGLNEIFFDENGTQIPELTRKYGVF